MRYLILLLLAGCTTAPLSEYQRGCRDGIEYSAPAMNFVPPEVDGLETREQQVAAYKDNVCINLDLQRVQRVRIDRFGPR